MSPLFLFQASPEPFTANVPSELPLAGNVRVRADFRASIDGPVLGSLLTSDGTITYAGQVLTFRPSYAWTRQLAIEGPAEVVRLYTTAIIQAPAGSRSFRFEIDLTRSYTTGEIL